MACNAQLFVMSTGFVGDYVVSFTPASSSKVKVSEGHSSDGCSYCRLTRDDCGQLKVTSVQSDDQKAGHQSSSRRGRFSQCDPVVPPESLLQLG